MDNNKGNGGDANAGNPENLLAPRGKFEQPQKWDWFHICEEVHDGEKIQILQQVDGKTLFDLLQERVISSGN